MAYSQNGNTVTIRFAGAPSGSCAPFQYAVNNATGAFYDCLSGSWNAIGAGGSGTVTSVSVTTANGVSGSVATATTTPAITLTLGAITPSSVAATGDVLGTSLHCGVLNTTSCVFTGYGSTSGTATLTWPAVAGTSSNSVVSSNAIQSPGFFPQSISAGPNGYYFDDFYISSGISLNSIGSPSGQNCSVTGTFNDVNHPGQMVVISGTAGTGTGEACNVGSSGAGDFNINTAITWTKESSVRVPVLPGTTNATYQVGFANAIAASPWITGVGFILSNSNGNANNWYCRYVTTSTDSTVAAVAANWNRLTIKSDGTNVHWYIDGVEVCGTGVAVASMQSGQVSPFTWTAVSASATSVSMAVDYVTIVKTVTR